MMLTTFSFLRPEQRSVVIHLELHGHQFSIYRGFETPRAVPLAPPSRPLWLIQRPGERSAFEGSTYSRTDVTITD